MAQVVKSKGCNQGPLVPKGIMASSNDRQEKSPVEEKMPPETQVTGEGAQKSSSLPRALWNKLGLQPGMVLMMIKWANVSLLNASAKFH
jgi:hypothetical protein